MTIPLSPARGDVWASGSQGQVHTDIRGAEVETPQGVKLKLVRNGSSSALPGCALVEYMSGDPTVHNVQRCVTDNDHDLAGAVDEVYANKGKTIAPGDVFWVAIHGPTHVLSSGTGITKGIPLAAKGVGTPGRAIQAASAIARDAKFGFALETQPSTNRSTLAYLQLG